MSLNQILWEKNKCRLTNIQVPNSIRYVLIENKFSKNIYLMKSEPKNELKCQNYRKKSLKKIDRLESKK